MKKITTFLMPIAISFNVNANNYCYKQDTNISMSYFEAKAIALNSECAKNAHLLKKHWCNEVTGTWWIAIHPYKNNPMCHPACVIDMATKTAVINWMCTGLIPSGEQNGS
jgi:hypothetical protein